MKIIFRLISILFLIFISLTNLFAQVSVGIGSDTEVSAEEMDIHVSGDWNNEGTFTSTEARLIFVDAYDQYIFQKSGSPLPHLEINKHGGVVILGDSLIISDTLGLISGKITMVDTAILTMTSGAVIDGGSDSSFVDGPFAKVLAISATELFQFPAGADQDYRPVEVSFSNIAGDSIIVMTQQINESAQGLSTEYAGLDKVSLVRYWNVQKSGTGSFSQVSVTFSYDTTVINDGVEIASELRVAQLDTGETWVWRDRGGTGTKDYSGTIKSGTLTDLQSGIYTLGDASGGMDISLPVELTSFELSEKRGDVSLKWKTEAEVNNSHWLIQRKLTDNTDEFETVAQLEGHGTFPSETEYLYIDLGLDVGEKYDYRLADVSISGRIKYHDTQSIEVGLPCTYALYQNYPNPFNPTTTIKYDLPTLSDVKIVVYNILGQRINRLVDVKQKPGYYKLKWDGTNEAGVKAASGMYIFAIQAHGVDKGKQKNFQKAKKMVLLK